MNILKSMVKDNEIDKDLFDLFIHKEIYLDYAKDNVDSAQIDDINKEDLFT